MTNIQELVLVKMQALSTEQQQSVLQFIDQISSSELSNPKHIEELLLEGLESLERGEGIEATDQWWEQERNALIKRFPHSLSNL